MKILATADWHIRDKDIDECEKCLDFLVDTALAESVDLVAISGDVFDSQEIKVDSKAAKLVVETISHLADICPVAIVTGTASHEGKATEILRFVRGAYPVFVADAPAQIILTTSGEFVDESANEGLGIDALAILSFVPQPTKQYWQSARGITGADQEISAAMSGLFAGFGAWAAEYPGVPHVLLYHGGISGARLPSGQVRTGMDIEVSTDQIMLANPDLVCCGHIHQGQQVGNGPVFYSGPIYATKIDEQGPNGFYIHEADALDPPRDFWDHRFIETPHKRTLRYSFDMTAGENVTIPFEGIGGASVRLDVTCWQDEAGAIDKAETEKAFLDAGAASVDIRITRIPRENVRAEAVLKADTLRQKIEQRAAVIEEKVDPAVLEMADLLEGTPTEMLLKQVMGGAA